MCKGLLWLCVMLNSVGAQLSWEVLVQMLEEGNLRMIQRKPEVEGEYAVFKQQLLHSGSNIDTNAFLHLLGRSGKTIEKCFKCATVHNAEGVAFDVYIQCDLERFTHKPWLEKFFREQSCVIAEASAEELADQSRNLIMLTRNIFKYNLEDEIDHWVFWCNQTVEKPFVEEIASLFVRRGQEAEHSIYIHINPVYNRSILKVFHAHMFVK